MNQLKYLVGFAVIFLLGAFFWFTFSNPGVGKDVLTNETFDTVFSQNESTDETLDSSPFKDIDTIQIWTRNNPKVPQKVLKVLLHVRHHNRVIKGYRGDEDFFNREKILPSKEVDGSKIKYKKWDVNPWIRGVNRGAERLITAPNRSYYTADHYASFTEINEKL
jgi:guanyl-specific ribonuclease Sa